MHRLKAIAAALLLVVSGLGVAVAQAEPAAAATPHCNDTWRNYLKDFNFNRWVLEPMYNPTTGASTLDCQLGLGDSGIEVTTLQDSLNVCNGAALFADGQYGKNTRDAVIAVQKAKNLTPDGIFGLRTASAMKWIMYNRAGGGIVGCTFYRTF